MVDSPEDAALYSRGRLRQVRDAVAAAGFDALLLTPSADLRYVTGYHAVALERLTCLIVPAEREAVLVVPNLERPAALSSPVRALDIDVVGWAETDDPFALVAGRLGTVRRVAMGNRMVAEHLLPLRDALGDAGIELANPVLAPLRARKSPAEVEALARAGEAIDRVHARIGEWLRPGRTEAQVGADVADAILAEGHTQVDFVIIGSGPNAASPHHEVSGRMIERGDVVVVDIGGTTADGYCSDSTRTYVAGGEVDPEVARYYRVLQHAQETACAAVKPGVALSDIDAAAREIITDAGYGGNFIHRTGHGIGMESHEEPYVVAGNVQAAEPGMAFSVEPGIYLAGRHGARIEDIVVCVDDGVRRLNHSSRDLIVL
jgi:Xaa-Pro aminopeptidase